MQTLPVNSKRCEEKNGKSEWEGVLMIMEFRGHKYFACEFAGHYACRNAEMNNWISIITTNGLTPEK